MTVDKLLAICGHTGIKTSPPIYNLSVSGLVSVNKQKPTHCLCNHLIDGLGGIATGNCQFIIEHGTCWSWSVVLKSLFVVIPKSGGALDFTGKVRNLRLGNVHF